MNAYTNLALKRKKSEDAMRGGGPRGRVEAWVKRANRGKGKNDLTAAPNRKNENGEESQKKKRRRPK